MPSLPAGIVCDILAQRRTFAYRQAWVKPPGRQRARRFVAGRFVADRGTHWPRVDPADSIYLRDLAISIGVSGTSGPPKVMYGR